MIVPDLNLRSIALFILSVSIMRGVLFTSVLLVKPLKGKENGTIIA
jgi:hypothetical protein